MSHYQSDLTESKISWFLSPNILNRLTHTISRDFVLTSTDSFLKSPTFFASIVWQYDKVMWNHLSDFTLVEIITRPDSIFRYYCKCRPPHGNTIVNNITLVISNDRRCSELETFTDKIIILINANITVALGLNLVKKKKSLNIMTYRIPIFQLRNPSLPTNGQIDWV